jgi:hypothetical protein
MKGLSMQIKKKISVGALAAVISLGALSLVNVSCKTAGSHTHEAGKSCGGEKSCGGSKSCGAGKSCGGEKSCGADGKSCGGAAQ